MEIEKAIDIIDKELHKKWDKKVERKDGMTYIHLGDEEPLNEFEKASQRVLVEVQSLNREIEILNSIIKEVRGKLYDLNYKIKEIHNVPFDISEIFEMIEILDKVDKEKE